LIKDAAPRDGNSEDSQALEFEVIRRDIGLTSTDDYARLGEKDTAFFWLEKAYDGHRIPFFIKTQPQLDKIRSDARYADLLRRMGLPQ
jgi:hypothetical protein